MADESLKQFKVGDRQRPRVAAAVAQAALGSRPGPAAATAPGGEGGSRFTRIEEVLDQEDPRHLGERLVKMLDDLETYAHAHKSARAQAAAKQGRAAVERTIDLLDHLYRVREALAKLDGEPPLGAEKAGAP